jgi:hypothetical protein
MGRPARPAGQSCPPVGEAGAPVGARKLAGKQSPAVLLVGNNKEVNQTPETVFTQVSFLVFLELI